MTPDPQDVARRQIASDRFIGTVTQRRWAFPPDDSERPPGFFGYEGFWGPEPRASRGVPIRVLECIDLAELGPQTYVQFVWDPRLDISAWSIADGRFQYGGRKYPSPTDADGNLVHEARTTVSQTGHEHIEEVLRKSSYYAKRNRAFKWPKGTISTRFRDRKERLEVDRLDYFRAGGVQIGPDGRAKISYTSGDNLWVNDKEELSTDGVDNRVLLPPYRPDFERAIFRFFYGRDLTPKLSGVSSPVGPDDPDAANLLRLFVNQPGRGMMRDKKRAVVIRAYQEAHPHSWFRRLQAPLFPRPSNNDPGRG